MDDRRYYASQSRWSDDSRSRTVHEILHWLCGGPVDVDRAESCPPT